MVGASPQVFDRIAPLLAYIGSDISHCGAVGAGQVVKLVNNALVFEHTAALAEQTGTPTDITALTRGMYASAVEKGLGRRYFPCIIELIESTRPPGSGGTA